MLFLYGVLAAGTSGSSLFVGGLLGLAAGAFTALTYYGLLSIPARYIFAVTTVLIALLAAGMAAQAVQYLDNAGVISVLGRRLWDSSGILPQDGMLGRLRSSATDRPTELQLLAYLGTLALMAALAWVATPARSPRTRCSYAITLISAVLRPPPPRHHRCAEPRTPRRAPCRSA